MADLAQRGASVSFGGAGTTTGGTLVIPSTVETGDVLFVAITSRDHLVGTARVTVTDDDGAGNTWALMTGGETGDRKGSVYWKRATSATASKTITVAGGVGSTAAVLKCFLWPVASGDPFSNVVIETNGSGDESHATATISQVRSMVCAVIFNYANDNAVTVLSFATAGATTMTEALSSAGSDCAVAFGHVLQVANTSTGTLTWAQANGTTYSLVFAIVPGQQSLPPMRAKQQAVNRATR